MTITLNYSAPPESVAQNLVQISVAYLLRQLGNMMSDEDMRRSTISRAVVQLISLGPSTYQRRTDVYLID